MSLEHKLSVGSFIWSPKVVTSTSPRKFPGYATIPPAVTSADRQTRLSQPVNVKAYYGSILVARPYTPAWAPNQWPIPIVKIRLIRTN